MSCGDVEAFSRPRISLKRLLWADWIPEADPLVKYFSNPLCLKLRIMNWIVTYYVTSYKYGMPHNASLSGGLDSRPADCSALLDVIVASTKFL